MKDDQTTVAISEDVYEQMVDHARREAPLEACAMLLGTEGRIDEYRAMTNTDESEVHFQFDPKEQHEVMMEARESERDILGVFHSHPSPESEAYPSEEDLSWGWSQYVYFILNFQPDDVILRAFRIEDDEVVELEYRVEETVE